MNTPVYIDKNLITAVGAQLVGLRIDQSSSISKGLSLNWLIQSNLAVDETTGVGRDIREFLPEHILYMIYPELKCKFESVEGCIEALSKTGEDRILPGEPLAVKGILHFPDLKIETFDPFNPPDIEVPTFLVHGEECFVGRLEGNGFRIPLYFLKEARQQVLFCNSMPVEVVGIIRWSPAYSTGGAKSLNSIVRIASLLLR
jgi:hypothetical protein